ncbi:P-loop containing nucleoside triphosphate hydrolase [Arabidopsis suecica]|uniref:P-loop containing nucleoside triphosphate hydrolase n=1 Tax=Arabidopsis suecica TaxID=45249 RepID=A0A8T2AF97_ARASU|nr:P-loop containing nucleoside triphosphate hydrolase [Arabidopsis suecica]
MLTSRFLEVWEVARADPVRPIAKAVSRECGGFPLAIITVGTSMRGKTNVKLWKHALSKLSRSVPWIKSNEEKIFQPLKLSYDFLEAKLKSCFLLCVLFPEDYSIEVKELVMYWVAEGLMEGQGSHEHDINKAITIVESLKDYCLLEDGAHKDTVKMHDIVRDFAIWIMSSSQDGFHSLVMAGKDLCGTHIKEFPRGLQELKNFRHLDLSQTPCLESIPASLVSRLLSLETLDMTSSHYQWNIQGEAKDEEAKIEEIRCLKHLQVLSIRLHSSPSLLTNNNIWIKRLKNFQILVGSGYILPTRHDKQRLTTSHLNVTRVHWVDICLHLKLSVTEPLSRHRGNDKEIGHLQHQFREFKIFDD